MDSETHVLNVPDGLKALAPIPCFACTILAAIRAGALILLDIQVEVGKEVSVSEDQHTVPSKQKFQPTETHGNMPRKEVPKTVRSLRK